MGRRDSSMSEFSLVKEMKDASLEFERGSEFFFFNLGDGFFLIEFKVAEEGEKVIRMGIRRFKDKTFHLERWGPEVGCLRLGVHANHC